VTVASYDGVASWYEQWVADSPSMALQAGRDLFPADLTGLRVLDVACVLVGRSAL